MFRIFIIIIVYHQYIWILLRSIKIKLTYQLLMLRIKYQKLLNYISSKDYNNPFIDYTHDIKNNTLKP